MDQHRQESQDRYLARKLERSLIQHKSCQPVAATTKQEMEQLEVTEPALVEELMLKKKWRNVQKDPQRALNDQSLDVSSYWQQLNNLPSQGVDKIVNPRILKYDKNSCDYILKRILDSKQKEDAKHEVQMRDRVQLRGKLRDKHNQTLELEAYCGVRLGQ